MKEQQLSEGWQIVKFGDIAKHISKRVEPSETDLDIYVGLEHLDPDNLQIKRHGIPSDVEGQKLLVKKGQIIFGKRRAYQRKVAVADWDCICSAHAMVLEANPKTVIPEFLPFFMQSDVFMNRAIAISEGSLSPTIKWKVLGNQFFAFPDISVQKKLLSVCMTALRAVKTAETVNGKNNQLYSILSRYLLENGLDNTVSKKTKYGMVPSNWELVPFEELTLSGTQNGLYKGSEFYGSGLPMIHMGEMFKSSIISNQTNIENRVLLEASEISKFGLLKDDLLFARRSLTVDGAGLCCIYKGDDLSASFESSIIRVSLNKEISDPDFYNIYFRSTLGRWNMAKIIQTVAASGITGSDLKKILVPLPPLDEQKRIAHILISLSKIEDSHDVLISKIASAYLNQVFEE